MSKSLFQPIQLGSLTLKNRIVMPPMHAPEQLNLGMSLMT